MELSGVKRVVESQSAGDAFSIGDLQFVTDADGLVEVPVELLAEIESFGFVLTNKEIAVVATDPAPTGKK